jgi:hypothetical protein
MIVTSPPSGPTVVDAEGPQVPQYQPAFCGEAQAHGATIEWQTGSDGGASTIVAGMPPDPMMTAPPAPPTSTGTPPPPVVVPEVGSSVGTGLETGSSGVGFPSLGGVPGAPAPLLLGVPVCPSSLPPHATNAKQVNPISLVSLISSDRSIDRAGIRPAAEVAHSLRSSF